MYFPYEIPLAETLLASSYIKILYLILVHTAGYFPEENMKRNNVILPATWKNPFYPFQQSIKYTQKHKHVQLQEISF